MLVHAAVFALVTAAQSPTLMVGGSAVNLRQAPHKTGAVVAKLPFGARVQTLGTQGKYTHIKVGTLEGYLATSLLRPVGSAPRPGDLRLIDSYTRPAACRDTPTPNCVTESMFEDACGAARNQSEAAAEKCEKRRRAERAGAIERRAHFRSHRALDARTGLVKNPPQRKVEPLHTRPTTPAAGRAELWTSLLGTYEDTPGVLTTLDVWSVPQSAAPKRVLAPLTACPEAPLPDAKAAAVVDAHAIAASAYKGTVHLGEGSSAQALSALTHHARAAWQLDRAGALRTKADVPLTLLSVKAPYVASIAAPLTWAVDRSGAPMRVTHGMPEPDVVLFAGPKQHAQLKKARFLRAKAQHCAGWERTDTYFDVNGDGAVDLVFVRQNPTEGAGVHDALLTSDGKAWHAQSVRYFFDM